MSDTREQYAEKLLATVNEAAKSVSTRFVTFLTVSVYVAVTIASTTDEMLVRAHLVTLPLLNTQIPISGPLGFYTVAPWLIVLLHADFLLQLSMLGGKLTRFQAAADALPEETSTPLRERMASFYYVQFLTRQAPTRFLTVLAGLIMWLTMVVLPLALLLWIQVRFLPFHSQWATALHRVAVIGDAILILFLWPQVSPRRAAKAEEARTWRRVVSVQTLVGVMCAASVLFSLGIATIPGDEPAQGSWFRQRNLDLRERVLTNPLPAEVINALRDGDVAEREQQLERVSPLNFLQGRDLRHANLYNAVLPRLDLRSRRDEASNQLVATDLRGADLRWSQMQGVLLDEADVSLANLQGAHLQGASLWSTLLQGANLADAQLQDARLGNARLDGAVLARAQMQGAVLAGARLEGADLSGAVLDGADLNQAQLQNADLSGALLRGADLSGANLDGARLRGAQFQATAMRETSLQRADMADVALDSKDANQVTALLNLACAEPYTARGIARQALYSQARDRSRLVAALLQADPSRCRGLQLLPPPLRDSLARATMQPPAPPPPTEATPALPQNP